MLYIISLIKSIKQYNTCILVY